MNMSCRQFPKEIKDTKPIVDDQTFERMLSTLGEVPYFQRYFSEGKNSIHRMIINKDTQAPGILFELLLWDKGTK